MKKNKEKRRKIDWCNKQNKIPNKRNMDATEKNLMK